MTGAAVSPVALLFLLILLVFLKDPVAGGFRTLCLGFEILIQRGELLLLLRRQPICFGPNSSRFSSAI